MVSEFKLKIPSAFVRHKDVQGRQSGTALPDSYR